MPKCYGYLRVSHDDSARSGLGMEHQRMVAKRYFELLRERAALFDLTWGAARYPDIGEDNQPAGFFYDAAVSAYTRPFLARPAGRLLGQVLEPGDHIIIARMDRGFRNLQDQLNTIRLFDKRKLSVHFAQEMCDMSTAHGRLMMQFQGAINEWYPAFIGERTREAFKAKRARGIRHLSPTSPGYGLKGVRVKGVWRMFDNHEQLMRLKRLLVMRSRHRMSYDKISDHFRARFYRQCKADRKALPWGDPPSRYGRQALNVLHTQKWLKIWVKHQKECLALCYVGDPKDPANWGWEPVSRAYREWLGYKNPVPTI